LDAIAFLANPFDFLSNPHRHCLSAASSSLHFCLQFVEGEVSQGEDVDAGSMIDFDDLFADCDLKRVDGRNGRAVNGVGGSCDSHGVYLVVGVRE